MTLNKAVFAYDDIYQALQTGEKKGSINLELPPTTEASIPYKNIFTTKPPPEQTVKQSGLSIAPSYKYEVFVFISKNPEEPLLHWDESRWTTLESCLERVDYIKKTYETEVEKGAFFAYKVVAYKQHVHIGAIELIASYEKVGKVKEKVYLNGPKKAKSKAALTNHLNKLQGAYTNVKN